MKTLFNSQDGEAELRIKVPKIEGVYTHVYKPAGDVFPGPDEAELKAGQFYEEWVSNDHCFIKGDDGCWHAFGITHPRTSLKHVHAGENQLFHAVAPQGELKDVLREGAWIDLPKVLPPAARPGEPRFNHAPYIVKQDDLYYMIYGPAPLRFATSRDLQKWTPKGELSNPPAGRDPNVLFYKGAYYILVCGRCEVWMVASKDLIHCEISRPILRMKGDVDPESPALIRHNGTFYLFVCGWNGVWDMKDISGAYQHITCVYQSDDPFTFDASKEVTRLEAHAPEIFQDEEGNWYISSAEWPDRGVSIARLAWV